MSTSKGLSKKDIYGVVNRYIGVSGGYLGDFSYRSHHDFYLEYCDLDINPHDYEGTTRERFIHILSESDPGIQANILEGILEKYPVGSNQLRTQERFDEVKAIIAKIRSIPSVESPELAITSNVVERAISDTEMLIKSSGATSGVDRIHTALHGYLKAVCDEESIYYSEDPGITHLFKLIREEHPAFKSLGSHQAQVIKVLRSFSSVVDALNPARNRGSVAHPNKELLDNDEAMLFINAARTILHYLDAKISKTT